MSTSEDTPLQKSYFCELCQITCINGRAFQTHIAGVQHKKNQRALKKKGKSGAAQLKKLQSDIPPPMTITHLKDYMNDPERPEPLIGMEYLLEFRYKGRKDPFYECQLCGFSTEAVPMIEHITGQNHRRLYLIRHHPEMTKRRNPNENRFLFFKRMAEELEKEEGLKKYKCEVHERPYILSTKAKKKKRLLSKNPNRLSRKRSALEYLETFKITSDAEAARVLSIATNLSASLKTFCQRSKRLFHMGKLPSLMEPGNSNTIQASESEPTNPASESEPTNPASESEPTDQASENESTDQVSDNESTASEYVPTQPFTNYKQGNKGNQNWNEEGDTGDTNWTTGDKNWKLGHLSKGIAQLKSLLEQTSSISHTPSDSYGRQIGRSSQIATSSGVNATDRATMSALQNSFALQPGNAGFGINEMMKQFNQTASVYCQSPLAGKMSPYFTSPQGSLPLQGNRPLQGSHLIQQHQGNDPKVPNNRMVAGRIRPWDSTRDTPDSREFPLAPISYPVPMGYQTNQPTQGFPSWLGNRSMSGNEVSASFSSEKNLIGCPQPSGFQQLNFRGNMGLNPPFSGNPSFSNYQQQNTQVNSLLGGTNSGLTADIMRQLHGKDVATLTAMLQQLVPHYPDLQKIDIQALARTLSQMS